MSSYSPDMGVNSRATRRLLDEAQLNRERLFGERENLRARVDVDGPSDGLEERVGNLNRAIAERGRPDRGARGGGWAG